MLIGNTTRFIADAKLMRRLPKLLGKTMYETKKYVTVIFFAQFSCGQLVPYISWLGMELILSPQFKRLLHENPEI